MKKTIIIFLLALFLFGCGGCGNDESAQVELTHCYLAAGLCMVNGDVDWALVMFIQEKDKWEPYGAPITVWRYYNTHKSTIGYDPDYDESAPPALEYYIDDTPTVQEIFDYLYQGYRVSVIFKNGTTNHVVYLEIIDNALWAWDLCYGQKFRYIFLPEQYELVQIDVVGNFN